MMVDQIAPIIKGEDFKIAKYELVFFVGTYFESINNLKKPYFLDDIIIRFGINNSFRTLPCTITGFTMELFYL